MTLTRSNTSISTRAASRRLALTETVGIPNENGVVNTACGHEVAVLRPRDRIDVWAHVSVCTLHALLIHTILVSSQPPDRSPGLVILLRLAEHLSPCRESTVL